MTILECLFSCPGLQRSLNKHCLAHFVDSHAFAKLQTTFLVSLIVKSYQKFAQFRYFIIVLSSLSD